MKGTKSLLSAIIALSLIACSEEEGGAENIGLPSDNVAKVKGELSEATSVFIIESNESVQAFASNHNLYKMDDQGSISEAIETPWSVSFSHTILSPDRQSLYALVDLDKVWENENFLKYTRCGVLKLNLESGTTSCAVENVLVQTPYQHGIEINDERFKALQFDSQGNLYFLKIEFDFYEGGGIDLSKGTVGELNQYNPKTAEFKTITEYSADSFIVNANDSLVYRDTTLNWVTDLTDIAGSKVVVGSKDFQSGWYSIDDNSSLIFSDFFTTQQLHFAQLDENKVVHYVSADVDSTDVPGNLEGTMIGDDGAVYGIYAYAKQIESEFYWRHAVRRLFPFSETITADYYVDQTDYSVSLARGAKVMNQHLYYIERQFNENNEPRDVIKIGTLDDQVAEVLFDSPWATLRLKVESWKTLGESLYFSALNEVTGEPINGHIDTAKFLAGETDFLTVNEGIDVAPYTVIGMEQIKQPQIEQPAPQLLKIDTAEANLHSASLSFNVPMDTESLQQALSITNTTTSSSIDSLLIQLGGHAHLVFNPNTDFDHPTEPLAFNQAYQIKIDDSVARSELGEALTGCEYNNDCAMSWDVRPDKDYLLSVTDDSEMSTPFSGKHLRSYDYSVDVRAFEFGDDKLLTGSTVKWGIEMTILPYDFRVDVDYEDEHGNSYSPSVLFKSRQGAVILTEVIPNQWYYSKVELEAKETTIRITVERDQLLFTVIDPLTGFEQQDRIPLNSATKLGQLSVAVNGGEIQTMDNIKVLSWNSANEESIRYQQDFDHFSSTAAMQAVLEDSVHFNIY